MDRDREGSLELHDERPLVSESPKTNLTRRRLIINSLIVAIVLVIFLIVVITLILVFWPELPDVHSPTGFYEHAAIASDAPQCSTIGRTILESRNGSAVDAAIATMLCLGVHSAQSCGIGGGFLMVVYDVPVNGSTNKTLTAIDAREVAPGAATQDMFMDGTSSTIGGKSIAVPGEILGMYAAWSKYGRLPWKDLFQPTIDLCRNGYVVDFSLGQSIAQTEDAIRNTPSLKALFVKADGRLYKEGDTMTRPTLAMTLERISNITSIKDLQDGIFRDIVQDIRDYDGIITEDDFIKYKVKVTPTLEMKLTRSFLSIQTLHPPSSGVIYGFMLRLIEGFNLTRSDVATADKTTEVYHKMIESFKFSYALRTYLGDGDFVDNTKMMRNLTSQSFADEVRRSINLTMTQPLSYYGAESQGNRDGGTSHLSILAANGGAVSVTSTINLLFGSQRVGKRTGIIFNDEMDDFSRPGPYVHGLAPSRENFIESGKRPMSSMCPAIILDLKQNVFMVIGAAGGPTITTGAAFVTAYSLWLGKSISSSVDQYRIHDQLLPTGVFYDSGLSKTIQSGLKSKGHDLRENPELHNVVQAIQSTCNVPELQVTMYGNECYKKCITAVCDGRKQGQPDGY